MFNAAPDAVKKAAVIALVANGFNVTKQDARYIEGTRPRPGPPVPSTPRWREWWGLAGGETTAIWIEALDDTTSRVHVDTVKTFLGLAGQQNWDSEIIIEID